MASTAVSLQVHDARPRPVLAPNTTSASGAVMVEVALTMMIFLALVFGLIFIAMAMNARTALTLSVAQAMRYGVTRGDVLSMDSVRNIPDIHAYVNEAGAPLYGDSASAPTPTLAKYLYSRGLPADDDGPIEPGALSTAQLEHIDSQVAGVFDGRKLFNFPAQYVYTLVYAHEFMRTRVGAPNVKYPCDDRPNCLKCEFLNPNAPLNPDIDPRDTFSGEVPPGRVYLQCRYQADFGFFNTVLTFLNPLGERSPGLEFTHAAFVNRDRDQLSND